MIQLERFSAGESFSVDPDAIERELASVWRTAGQASTDENQRPVTRACLWNIIVHLEERDRPGKEAVAVREEALGELAKYLAVRSLVLRTQASAPKQTELESYISAKCIVSEGGGKLVCSEEITLLSRGEGERHLPSLVRALLVPSVPTAAIFGAVPALEDPHIAGLLRGVDRCVIDLDNSPEEGRYRRVKELSQKLALGVVDLNWIALEPIRSSISMLFDSPKAAAQIPAIDTLELAAPFSRRSSSNLILGWLLDGLDADLVEGSTPQNLKCKSKAGSPLKIIQKEDSKLSVRMFAGGRKVAQVQALDDGHMVLASGDQELCKATPKDSAAAIVAKSLNTMSYDASFMRAVEKLGDCL